VDAPSEPFGSAVSSHHHVRTPRRTWPRLLFQCSTARRRPHPDADRQLRSGVVAHRILELRTLRIERRHCASDRGPYRWQP
jgi:hypothetical protein